MVALGSSAPCPCAFWLVIEIGRNLIGSTPTLPETLTPVTLLGFLRWESVTVECVWENRGGISFDQ